MKKIIALALVVLMIGALGVAVFADEVVSPGPKKEDPIVIIDDDDAGDVEITYDEETDTYKVVIHVDEDHKFIKWEIDGDITIIEGSEEDIEIIFKKKGDGEVVIRAITEPISGIKVTVEEGTKGGTATVTKNADGTYTLKASTENGYKFTKWALTGEYTVVSGSLTSETLVIKPTSSVHGIAYWNGESTDNKSPKMGYGIVAMTAVVLVSVAGAAFAFKKFENE